MRDFGAIVVALGLIAFFWALRRYLPPVTCPNCGSTSWLQIDDSTKECRDCGRMFML